MKISRSDDLVHFEHLGFALEAPNQQHYWAPSVIYKDGRFYMYYSSDETGTGGHSGQILRLAVADRPQGPFTYRKTLFPRFSIDSHIVRDRDGDYYLFYTPEDYAGSDAYRPGVVVLVDRLLDMETLEGKPKMVIYPSLDEEIYEKNRFGDGRDWYTIEGGFYLTHNNTAYTMYSGNAFYDENYFIGYARAPLNGPIREMKWQKYPDDYTYDPLVRKNEFVEGTGHNSVVKAPNGVGDWIAYHGRSALTPIDFSREERQLRIDPLYFDHDRLFTNAPSHLSQSAPPMPLYRDLFTSDIGAWETTGAWQAADYAFSQTDCGRVARALLAPQLDQYYLEVDAKLIDYGFSSRFGVLLAYFDELNYLALVFNSGREYAELVQIVGGVASTVCKAPLGQGYDISITHNLKIDRAFERFTVRLDDRILFDEQVAVQAGRVGLCTMFSRAEFAGFCLTEHINLYGAQIGMLGRLFESDTELPAGSRGLVCNIPMPARLTGRFKHTGAFEQNITFDVSGPTSQADWYPAYADEQNHIRVHVCDDTARVTVQRSGNLIAEEVVSLSHRQFTVKTICQNGSCFLAVSNRFTGEVPFDCTGMTSRLTLERAAVLDYEYTSLAE